MAGKLLANIGFDRRRFVRRNDAAFRCEDATQDQRRGVLARFRSIDGFRVGCGDLTSFGQDAGEDASGENAAIQSPRLAALLQRASKCEKNSRRSFERILRSPSTSFAHGSATRPNHRNAVVWEFYSRTRGKVDVGLRLS